MAPIPNAARTKRQAPALPSVLISVLCAAQRKETMLGELGAILREDGVVSWEGFCIKGGSGEFILRIENCWLYIVLYSY